MKKLLLASVVLAALGAGLLNYEYKSPIKTEGEFAPEGMVAYAASYSSDITNEPNYTTQNSTTFQYLNLGSTLSTYRGDSVKVGIIDSGINYDHEDFMVSGSTKVKPQSKYWKYQNSQWEYYSPQTHNYSYIDDTLGHGTNVAATVAAAINGVGGLGLAPNVELYVYKVTNSSNGYEFGAIQSALMDAVTLGIKIINMSFQSYEHQVSYNGHTMNASSGCSTILSHFSNGYSYTNFLKDCYDAGITLIGAAGNYNTDEPSYPGSNDYVINVGSLDETGTGKAGFSNYGSTIDLVAPGYVYVADEASNTAYTNTSGTSFSAPLVTAACALYKQKYPSATPAQIESALYASCDEIDDSGSAYTNWAGHGSLNVARFLGQTDYPTDIVINNPEIIDDTLDLEVGDSFDLDWTVNGEGSFDNSVEFSIESETNSVVSVDSSGTITALGEGEDYIYITSTVNSDVYAMIQINVTAPSAPQPTVSSVTVTPSTLDLDLNGTKTGSLTATVNGDNNPSQIVTWSSSNTSVATVSAAGVVTAKATGSATITATSQQDTNKSGTCSVTVIDSGALPTSEDINDYNIGTTALTSSGISNGAKVVLGTTSSNLAYSVDSNWVYVGTVRDATYVFTIEGNSSGFKLKNGNNYIYCSSEKKVALSTSQSTTFVLNNNNYVGNTTVGYFCFNSTGLRPYKSTGSYSSFGYLYPLTPKATLTSISVKTTPSKLNYEAGNYFDPTGLVITKTFSDSSTQDLAYSGNTSSFTFTPSLSTALTISDVSVTITVDGKSCSQAIIVTAAKTLLSISISGYTTSFVEGDTFSFGGTVTANFSDSTTSNVTANATFSGYNLTTVSNQTVTVSYTYNGTTKTQTYQITVTAGTLSSISLSGQTTTYQKNYAFSFDGVCTATFENSYQKTVTPTSVSSPDMTTAGQKTVTVSYTYNGVNKTTSYTITVNSSRQVIEEGESVLGTITYTTDVQVISNNTLSTTSSGGFSQLDTQYHAWRLGASKSTGTLTVTSTTSNITKIVVNARYYSNDSGTTFTIGGTSKTLTNSYADYEKTYSTPTNSIAISSVTNGKRVLIASITVYAYLSEDISQSSDCVGLETFIDNYMHMDYVTNLGYCKDSEHHYYSSAKAAFNALNTHQRSLFTSNSAYTTEWTRLSAWATANGDSLNGSNTLAKNKNLLSLLVTSNSNETIVFILVFSLLGMSTIGGYLFIRRKYEK